MIKKLQLAQTFVFDLDNTLYPETSDLFPQVEKLMGQYIVQKLKVSEYQALQFQKTYFMHYGTTLAGLMKHHDVHPDEYMEFVHNIDYSIIKRNDSLIKALENMNKYKVIYTNGSLAHAHNVLHHLGVSPKIFDKIYDVADAQYIPKPAGQAFDIIFSKFPINYNRSVMVEDIAKNLIYPKKLGMTTILMKTSGHLTMNDVPNIDYFYDDIVQVVQDANSQ